jgi:hypothetical protein
MTVTDIEKPPPGAAPAGRHVSASVRLAWLHLRSRRAPSGLLALLACGVALWASLRYHWWLGTGNAADELPMILQGCAAGIIAVSAHSPFGEPEVATGRRLPLLRAGLVLALCAAAIGFFALAAAAAPNPRAGVYLAGGILPVVRNVAGMTGIGVIFCLVAGAQIAWIGPLAFTAISQFALVANYSEPLTWPTRPPADRGGWIAALVVFAVGLIVFTVRGPRVRQSGELRRQQQHRRRPGRHRARALPWRGRRRQQRAGILKWQCRGSSTQTRVPSPIPEGAPRRHASKAGPWPGLWEPGNSWVTACPWLLSCAIWVGYRRWNGG